MTEKKVAYLARARHSARIRSLTDRIEIAEGKPKAEAVRGAFKFVEDEIAKGIANGEISLLVIYPSPEALAKAKSEEDLLNVLVKLEQNRQHLIQRIGRIGRPEEMRWLFMIHEHPESCRRYLHRRGWVSETIDPAALDEVWGKE